MPRLTGHIQDRSLRAWLSKMLVLLSCARQRVVSGGFRRGLSRLACCLLMSLAWAIQREAQSSGRAIEERLAQAQAAYEKQQYQQAEAMLKAILVIPPAASYLFAANELLGLALTSQGRHAAASAYFKAAVRADPSSVVGRTNLAANLAQLNQHDLAEQELAERPPARTWQLRAKPQPWGVLRQSRQVSRGRSLVEAGQQHPAVRVFQWIRSGGCPNGGRDAPGSRASDQVVNQTARRR